MYLHFYTITIEPSERMNELYEWMNERTHEHTHFDSNDVWAAYKSLSTSPPYTLQCYCFCCFLPSPVVQYTSWSNRYKFASVCARSTFHIKYTRYTYIVSWLLRCRSAAKRWKVNDIHSYDKFHWFARFVYFREKMNANMQTNDGKFVPVFFNHYLNSHSMFYFLSHLIWSHFICTAFKLIDFGVIQFQINWIFFFLIKWRKKLITITFNSLRCVCVFFS